MFDTSRMELATHNTTILNSKNYTGHTVSALTPSVAIRCMKAPYTYSRHNSILTQNSTVLLRTPLGSIHFLLKQCRLVEQTMQQRNRNVTSYSIWHNCNTIVTAMSNMNRKQMA